MSTKEITIVQCPACGAAGEATVWDTLNTHDDPKARDALLDGTFFDYTCPECGQTRKLNYPVVYHDTAHQALVQYVMDAGQIEKASEEIQKIAHSEDELMAARFAKYRNRIVTSQNALREKAMIFHNGLDDRIVEIMKVLYASRVIETHPEFRMKEAYFLINPKGEMFIQFLGDRPLTIKAAASFYQAVAKDMADIIEKPEHQTPVIDLDWAYRMVRSKEQA